MIMYLIIVLLLMALAGMIRTRHARVDHYHARKRHLQYLRTHAPHLPAELRFTPGGGVKQLHL